ncbi:MULTISPECIES: spore coat protein [Mesobacillus]|uniref:spore coat protein n=1 Tax=Mesobacillus TaxID=2675231 RepID=UPI00177E9BFE|nr:MULTISPECIES: spore coat protein [Mesobacillus]MCM3573960.1 spore coat protein [Mesobacillus subterraneus]UYZ20276.1 spore coat protein [Mesobacillus jeotgali]
MSDNQQKPNPIPSSLVDLFVTDILQKNGISKKDIKDKITDDKKMAIKELVEDLSKQVESFVNGNSKPNKDSEKK